MLAVTSTIRPPREHRTFDLLSGQMSVLLMCCEIGKFRITYLADLDSEAIYKAGFLPPKYPLDSTREAFGVVARSSKAIIRIALSF